MQMNYIDNYFTDQTAGRYGILVDGQYWVDSDGNDTWDDFDVASLAQSIVDLGYDDVEIVEV